MDDDDSPKITREGIHLIRVGFKKGDSSNGNSNRFVVSVKPCQTYK